MEEEEKKEESDLLVTPKAMSLVKQDSYDSANFAQPIFETPRKSQDEEQPSKSRHDTESLNDEHLGSEAKDLMLDEQPDDDDKMTV